MLQSGNLILQKKKEKFEKNLMQLMAYWKQAYAMPN